MQFLRRRKSRRSKSRYRLSKWESNWLSESSKWWMSWGSLGRSTSWSSSSRTRRRRWLERAGLSSYHQLIRGVLRREATPISIRSGVSIITRARWIISIIRVFWPQSTRFRYLTPRRIVSSTPSTWIYEKTTGRSRKVTATNWSLCVAVTIAPRPSCRLHQRINVSIIWSIN